MQGPTLKKIHVDDVTSSERSSVGSVGRSATWCMFYPPHGQGIFTFNVLRKTPFEIVIRPDSTHDSAECISLAIERNKVHFQLGVEKLAERCEEGIGFDPDRKISYWFSLDRDNLVLKYGKGYFMEETTLLCFDFLACLSVEEQIKKRCKMKNFFGPRTKIIEFHDMLLKEDLINLYASYTYKGKHLAIGDLQEKTTIPTLLTSIKELQITKRGKKCMQQAEEMIDITNDVDFYPQPLIVNWPFAVKNSSEATLFELDKNTHIFTASLPQECQELYTNISSTNINLEWTPTDQKYKFSDAIRYSFETEGKTLNVKLKNKRMKYIRVTVGPSHATSPGIPYVLELWPRNEGSPVHCHGNSFGVIKVLHGGLRVEIYNRDMKTMIKHFDVNEGDITWMSPHWYQSHRLFNNTTDFCATLQCYRYGLTDTKMWPYFDYVNDDGSLGEFLPNSDFTFTDLHHTLLDEYSRHMLEIAGER